ncbi:DUF975 family protein [Liberiplasma polymorphum]|uniref:DUF975 family protein n=1 Tax=Liberiplasma polymorphum TaxID=3374570 RepID=UPI0037762ADF
MRVIKAFKSLTKNYYSIMPTFLFVTIVTAVISNIAPLIGPVILLPMTLSTAYVMLKAITKSTRFNESVLTIGFKPEFYIRNLFYLFIKQIAFLLPILLGVLVYTYVYRTVLSFELGYSIIITNVLVFAIPSAIISLMLSMVPYLLADPAFDQRKYNAFKVSTLLMRGNYVRLTFMRLFFVPWFVWLTSGFVLSFASIYALIFSGVATYPAATITWLATLPLTLLLINPWYMMMHAELYVTLKQKIKDII